MDDRTIARWRLANQQLTGPGLDEAGEVVAHLLGVQAENPSQSAWAVAARTSGLTEDGFAAAVDAGELLRTHVLRPTWHYVTPDDIGWLLELTRPRIWTATYRRQCEVLGLGPAELERSGAAIVAAIVADGHLTRDQVGVRLDADGLPGSGQALTFQLAHAELRGLVCSGVLADGVHTYALLDERAPDRRVLDRDEALAELAHRYLTSHGPATDRDLAYWATLTLTDARAGIAAVADELSSFDHDGRTHWHAGEPPHAAVEVTAEPRAHLLQLLDECYRGYQDSRWVLDADELVPRGERTAIGIDLHDAQLVAGMRRTVATATVTFELDPYRTLDADEVADLQAAADAAGAFLGRDAELAWVAPAAASREDG